MPADEEGFEAYLEAVARLPLLSKKEEDELRRDIRSEDVNTSQSARKRLIESQLRLVVSVARRYEHSSLPLVRLVGVGNEGLVRALARFDPASRYRFSSYATWWIRQALTRAIADQGRP